MDIRLKGRKPDIEEYHIPYTLKLIGEYIINGKINLNTDKDGNGYISFDRKKHKDLYEHIEQKFTIPCNSIEEININTDRQTMNIYTFVTVGKNALIRIRNNWRVGYGCNGCIGIHIDIREEYRVLYQLQTTVKEEEE